MTEPYVHVPETVSPQAQDFLRAMPDPALKPQFPEVHDIEGWKKLQAWAEADGLAKSEALLKRFEYTAQPSTLGGVPVLDVRPKGWTDDGRLIVYAHGGAHVMYSAKSSLGRAVVAAQATGLRVISVDYTLAPHARWQQIGEQVLSVFRALVAQGQRLENTVIYGDSSGGGLAAASVLRMRDSGLGLPAAAVLVSGWFDVTNRGDTETTLYHADPNSLYDKHGRYAAAAYADPQDQQNPYVSPVYGDFSKGFPPTLIQGGLKEVLLSGFVRLYQALDAAGVAVKLDLYEGMIHNFQDRIPDAPESAVALAKFRAFLQDHLDI